MKERRATITGGGRAEIDAAGGARPASGSTPARRVASNVVAVSSALLLAGTFLPWSTRLGSDANGWQSTLKTIALGDALASPTLRWLALSWYGIPLAAAGVWLTLWGAPRAVSLLRALGVSVIALSGISVYVCRASGARAHVLTVALVCATAVLIEVQAGRIHPAESRRIRRHR